MFYHQRKIRETYGYNYESLISSLGYEILLDEWDKDYQGDALCLLRNDSGNYGLLTFGFGSCSGCDAFEAAVDEGIEAVEELRDELDSGIKWFDTMDDLRGFLNSDDVGLRWYGHIRIFASFVKQVNELSV